MAFLTNIISVFLVVIICINAQSVPDRCRCLSASSQASRWKNIDTFSITLPRSRCKTTEIILTLKTINPKTHEKQQRCITPNIYQGEVLQECWNRLNKDGRKATIQMSKCEIFRNTTMKSENATTVSQR